VRGVGGRGATWAQRDFVAWGSALGGTVAWAGVVVSAALNYRRSTVPLLWWVLSVVVLVCFLALGGSQARTSTRDRAIFAVLALAAIGANAVWGADLMSGVLLVLVAGVAGWVVPARVSIPLMLALTLALALILSWQNATVVWALLYGALLFFASLMVHVVVREQAARREAAAVAAELEVANAQLLAANAALHEAQARLAEASRAEERLRISRDLHDGMGNQLTALSLQLDLIGRLVDGRATDHVAQAKALSAELLRDTRDVVSQLRDTRVSPRDRIARLARSLPRPTTSLDLAEGLDVVPDTVADTIVRVVQESLTNTARHSAADRAWVVVRCDAADVQLQVRDNGLGASAVVPGNGLSGMAERVALLSGELSYVTAPSAGFTVTVRIPLRAVDTVPPAPLPVMPAPCS
jgi:signal transduction histidine kinase